MIAKHRICPMTRNRLLGILVILGFLVNWWISLSRLLSNQLWEDEQIVITREFDGRPRVLLSYGCSGSSQAFMLMNKILRDHYGINRYGKVSRGKGKINMELFNPEKNFMVPLAKEKLDEGASTEELLKEALRMMHQDALKYNEILTMKLEPEMNDLRIFLDQELGARFTMLIRENPIDRTLCKIRDCFDSGEIPMGEPVFASNGSRSDLCVNRRSWTGDPVLAKCDTSIWPQQVVALSKAQERAISQFETNFPAKAQTYEDLVAYATSNATKAFETSFSAWMGFMEPLLNNHVDSSIVYSVLQNKRGTRRPSSPHSKMIYNHRESLDALRQWTPELADKYLRIED